MSKKDFLDTYFKETRERCEKITSFLINKRGVVGHDLFMRIDGKKKNFKGGEFVIKRAISCFHISKEGEEQCGVFVDISVVTPDAIHSVREYETLRFCPWHLNLKELDKNLYKKLIDFLKE